MLAIVDSTALAVMGAVATLLLGATALCHALASWAHATNHAEVADKLDVAEEAASVVGQVLDDVLKGVPLPEAIAKAEASPEAQDLLARGSAAFRAHFANAGKVASVLLLCLLLGACSSPITHERVEHLKKSVLDERKAKIARPGFEAATAKLDGDVDADLEAMLTATAPK